VAACHRSAYGSVKSAAVPQTLSLSTQTHTLRGDINTKHRDTLRGDISTKHRDTLRGDISTKHTDTRYVATLALSTDTLRDDISTKYTDTHVT
jgi:hypothetical protein